MLLNIAVIIIGYLLGSIPWAFTIAKLRKGIDIRDVDVGNVGAGATFRQVGVWEGIFVIFADAGKGAGAVFVAQLLGAPELWVFGAGFAAVLGHNYPLFIGFKGGQGAATIIGVFLVLAPAAMGITLLLIGAVLFTKPSLFVQRFFFGIACAAPALPVLIWLFDGSMALIIYSVFTLLFVVFKNLRRLKTPKALTHVHDAHVVSIDKKQ